MRSSVLLLICFVALVSFVEAAEPRKIWGIHVRGGQREDCDEYGNPRPPPTKNMPPPVQTTSSLPPLPPPVQTTSPLPPPPPPVKTTTSMPPPPPPPASTSEPCTTDTTPLSTPPAVSTVQTTSTTSSMPAKCTSGMVTDMTGKCVHATTSSSVDCASGTLNSMGQCVVTTTAVCADGMTTNSHGECVTPATSTSTCASNMSKNSSGECEVTPTSTLSMTSSTPSATTTGGVCPGETTTHKVVAGETCSSIAAGTQSSVEMLNMLNPDIKCESLATGQTIKVCGGSSTKSTPVAATTSSSACTETACGGITYATSNSYTGVVPSQHFASSNATTSKEGTASKATASAMTSTSPEPYNYDNGAASTKVSLAVAAAGLSALMLL